MYTTIILTFLMTTSFVHAHLGHDHSHETNNEHDSTTVENPYVSGKIFEVVLEACKDKSILHLSNAQNNEAISDATIEIVTDGRQDSTMKATTNKVAGSYSLPLKKNEGEKVNLQLKIKTPKGAENLSLSIAQWPKISQSCTN